MIDYEHQAIDGAGGLAPAKPRTPVKFLVLDPVTGNRSATWSAFTSRNKDDIYLMEVLTGQRWKTTHHPGINRVAMTSEAADADGVARAVIDSWPRETPKNGWSEGTSVLVPCAYLRASPEPIDDAIIQIPISPGHSGVTIRLLFEESDSEVPATLPTAFLVGVLARPNDGGLVHIVAEPVRLGAEQHASMAAMCDEARLAFPEDSGLSGRFVGVLGVEEHRFLVDLSVA